MLFQHQNLVMNPQWILYVNTWVNLGMFVHGMGRQSITPEDTRLTLLHTVPNFKQILFRVENTFACPLMYPTSKSQSSQTVELPSCLTISAFSCPNDDKYTRVMFRKVKTFTSFFLEGFITQHVTLKETGAGGWICVPWTVDSDSRVETAKWEVRWLFRSAWNELLDLRTHILLQVRYQ